MWRQQHRPSRERTLQQIEAFLKASAPSDILAPCAPGTKHPIASHKGGAWGWAEWDKCDKAGKGSERE